MQDMYITFTNHADPGAFWPKYDEETKVVMRLLDKHVRPVKDERRRNLTDFLNNVEVMKEFGRFG
ncbi:hypothetical protein R3P38DRAFT_1036342 [Favolaschia claudopus]|uniref:Uncharacterized protein n=1 Tax=Favolaschia claudopus TaxID=2862362 RepID=A0AAW0BJJ9_9AGAR